MEQATAYIKEEINEFVIDNEGKADWAIEQIKVRRANSERFVNAALQRIEMMQNTIQKEKEALERDNQYLILALQDYFDSVSKRETKTQKIVDLPSGKLVLKKARPDFIRDNDKLVEMLKDTEFVEQKPVLKWAELKKDLDVQGEFAVLKSTGEIVDGIKVEILPAEFEVK